MIGMDSSKAMKTGRTMEIGRMETDNGREMKTGRTETDNGRAMKTGRTKTDNGRTMEIGNSKITEAGRIHKDIAQILIGMH